MSAPDAKRLLWQLVEDAGPYPPVPPEAVASLLALVGAVQSKIAALVLSTASQNPSETGGDAGLDGSESPDRLLQAQEVAERLGVPEAFVYQLARRRQLPSVRVGAKYVRFRQSELERYIRHRSGGAASRNALSGR